MLVYPKTELFNLHVNDQADEALNVGYITADQRTSIKTAYPVKLYQPGPVAQAGLGLLTIIILLLSAGLLVLVFQLYNSISGFLVFYGLLCYVMLEIMARKNHFNSGVDNILMFTTAWLIIGGIGASMNMGENGLFEIFISLVAFVICAFLCLRFSDASIGIVAILALLSFVFFCYLQLGSPALQTFPFVMAAVSGLIYFISIRGLRYQAALYYRNTLKWIGILALFTLYASGNFHVVVLICQHIGQRTRSVYAFPLPGFLWTWTLLVPLIYVVLGIARKDRTLLRVGLVLAGVAVLTFLQYFPIVTAEVAMLIAGLFTVVSSYGIMRYLRVPRNGFTFDEADDESAEGANLEAVVVGEAFGNTQTVQNDTTFGGGSFGGAGAGERF
ncbi:hypothetical protein EXU57_18500 [Segetibacter sp. 3557_3]|uniref:hypothetical protein n=1 Tax=Segetibacter sp. 3557_3 TaxID=2547429 RepID=UPI001058447D|nr:hypothetical protein [Segetibacter sp. 3557_3]TDH23047.1 hypothetical protein EXU57_18500 [Segetibacter sp. 3557_3]